jgi:hypothetical protein
VCLLGGYGSSGMGFCPGKEKTNLECSLIIAIQLKNLTQFVKQMTTII